MAWVPNPDINPPLESNSNGVQRMDGHVIFAYCDAVLRSVVMAASTAKITAVGAR